MKLSVRRKGMFELPISRWFAGKEQKEGGSAPRENRTLLSTYERMLTIQTELVIRNISR